MSLRLVIGPHKCVALALDLDKLIDDIGTITWPKRATESQPWTGGSQPCIGGVPSVKYSYIAFLTIFINYKMNHPLLPSFLGLKQLFH